MDWRDENPDLQLDVGGPIRGRHVARCGRGDWGVIGRGVGFGFQFRALSDQLFGTPEKHMNVRKSVVQQVGGMGGMGLHVVNYF